MSPWLLLGATLALAGTFAAGTWTGIEWEQGAQAKRDIEAREVREADARQQRLLNDRQAGAHAQAVARLKDQLGDAREKLATLSGRACLDRDTVGVLNATGVLQRGAAAGEPAPAATAAAAGADDRAASERDVANYIALCRTRYAEVAEQLHRILDIEDRRHPEKAPR